MAGIPVLTQKGQEALKNMPPDLSAFCRNVLVQVNGKRSLDDIRNIFKGLETLEESIQKLVTGGYIDVSQDCKDIVKALILQTLGPKAPTLLKKLDELHAKYGDQCWDHIEELDKVARLFYGEVTAQSLKADIGKIIQDTRK